jgi:hypothetical protein
MRTDGIELVAMAPSMVTVGNSFKRESSYKFIRKIEYDVIGKMEKGTACDRSLQAR